MYQIPREEIARFLKNAYAFVMTSKSEFYPIAIVEAMASGIPYISTDVGIVKFLPGGMITADNKFKVAESMDCLLEDKKKYQALKKDAELHANHKHTLEYYLMEFNQIVIDKSI